jgi:hypothetical protein
MEETWALARLWPAKQGLDEALIEMRTTEGGREARASLQQGFFLPYFPLR